MSSIHSKNPEFFHRVSAEGTIVLLSLSDDEFFWEISGLAVDLWKDINGKSNWAEIKQAHREGSDLPDDEFDREADQFLADLIKAEIIVAA